MSESLKADVAVVGGGNAALAAALAAAEAGASVRLLEAAPEEERGGNSTYTAGAMRVVFDGSDALRALMPDLSARELAETDFGAYTADDYYDDMARLSHARADPDLVEQLVTRSHATLLWLRGNGVRFQPSYGRQAFKSDGRFRFWGGLAVEAWGGGPGLVAALYQAAAKAGVTVHYRAQARSLLGDGAGVRGVIARIDGRTVEVHAGAVVLACGGFEANAAWRARYLGPGWDLAKVRGTRFNQGDGIRMALEAGAMPAGNWSGCHAVAWDRNAPAFGDLAVGDGFQKHSYPFSIVVNAAGERFVDEGADFRNYTYAAYGRRVLEQPEQVAWQVFDAGVTHLLRDEYRIRQVTRATADTLEGLAARMEGVDSARFLATVRTYNDAVMTEVPFEPTLKTAAARAGSPRPSPTGPTGSRRRPSRPMPSPAASPLPSAASRSTRRPACRRSRARRSPASTRRASWSAGSSTATIRAARGWSRARSSAASPAPAPPASQRRARTRERRAHRLHRHGRHGRAHVPQSRAQA